MAEQTILSTENLSFSYGEHQILNGFSMDLKRGEFLALIGANGAGKSTIVKLLSGYLPMRSGEIYLDQKSIKKLKHQERASIMAVLSQNNTLNLPYSVEEIVLMGRISRHSIFASFSKQDRAVAERSLKELDVWHLRHRRLTALSGGEQQRVLIAAAIAQEPQLLILDEPTSSLDLGHSLELMGTLKSLQQKGIAILVISHDLQLMAEWCDRVILLKSGNIVAQGSVDDVMKAEYINSAYYCDVSIIYDENNHFLTLKKSL